MLPATPDADRVALNGVMSGACAALQARRTNFLQHRALSSCARNGAATALPFAMTEQAFR